MEVYTPPQFHLPPTNPKLESAIGVKQVARPNVGYCRQLVDFEKTSTGWGGLVVGSWLGEWYTPLKTTRAMLARTIAKMNLVIFWFPCIQTEIQIHKKGEDSSRPTKRIRIWSNKHQKKTKQPNGRIQWFGIGKCDMIPIKKLVQSFFDVRRSTKTLQKWSPTTFFRRIVTPLIRVVTPFIASRGPSHMKHCTFIQCTKVGNKINIYSNMSCNFDFIRFSAERWESEMMVQIGNIILKKDGGTKKS